MTWLRNFTDNKKAIAAGCLLAAGMILAGCLCPLVYEFNDDAMMRSILSGAYLGTPDGHAVYMKYPLTGVLSLLYRMTDRVPWLTIFWAGCIGCCVFVVLKTVIDYMREGILQVGAAILTAEVLIMLLFPHYVVLHYTIVAAVLGAAALFVLLAQKGEACGRRRNLLSIVLLWLCYMVRSQVFFMTMPFLLVALLWKLLRQWKQRTIRTEAKKICLYAAILAAGVGVCALVNGVMYGSRQWQAYQEYNEARTWLYDYTGTLYDEYKESYGEIGISKEQYSLIAQYGTVADRQLTTEQMNLLAQLREEEQKSLIPTGELLKKRFEEYYYRTLHETDFPYNAVVLLLYLGVFLWCLKDREWLHIALIFCLGAGRSLIWLYLMMQGRYPERVTISLYFIETMLLAGMLFEKKQAACADAERTCDTPEKVEKRKKRVVRVAGAGLVIGILMAFEPMLGEIKKGTQVAEQQMEEQQRWEELELFMTSHPENFYYLDVYSMVHVSGRQYERTDYENYMLLGGWMTRSVLQEAKQQSTGYGDCLTALQEGRNIYFVAEKSRDIQWLEDYAASVGNEMKLEFCDRVGDYCIYSGSGAAVQE